MRTRQLGSSVLRGDGRRPRVQQLRRPDRQGRRPRAVVDAALDAGITSSTPPTSTAQGKSEEFIGRALERAPRPGRPRDEVRQADGRGRRRLARLARVHPPGGRGVAPPAADRLDRPLPATTAPTRDADRGDARRAARSSWTRARSVRSARRTSARRSSRRRVRAAERGCRAYVSEQSEYSWLERERGGGAPARLRAPRRRRSPLLPARERPPHRQVQARRAGARGHAPRTAASSTTSRLAGVERARGVGTGARRLAARGRDRRSRRAAARWRR